MARRSAANYNKINVSKRAELARKLKSPHYVTFTIIQFEFAFLLT